MRSGFAIFLNGSYGVGKSSVLDHIGDGLADAGQPFSLMDVDWFHPSWPPRSDDPDNVVTEADNMAAVWTNYLSAGPRQLVISGVLATTSDRDRYEAALGLTVRSVRLVASPPVTQVRLRERYSARQHRALDWHLQRHEDLGRRLTGVGVDEAVIDTDELTPDEVASRVLSHFGYSVQR